MKHSIAPALLMLIPQAVLAAEPSEQAKQNYVCAGVAGLASQLLASSDAQAATRLEQRAQLLAQSGVAVDMGNKGKQSDAIATMAAFLRGRADVYRADPAAAVSDLAACRAKGMLPAGPAITTAQVASAAGVPAPPPARHPAPPPTARAAVPVRPTASPDAEFRRSLLGPWGRMLTGGSAFNSEMIMSTVNRREGPQFTRKSCPPAGLNSTAELLSHEIWFEERPGGQFGIVRAKGDPGKTTTSWTELRFKDQPDADTFRYEFHRMIRADVAATETLILKRAGPDRIIHTIVVPGVTLSGNDHWYGRCRRS